MKLLLDLLLFMKISFFKLQTFCPFFEQKTIREHFNKEHSHIDKKCFCKVFKLKFKTKAFIRIIYLSIKN